MRRSVTSSGIPPLGSKKCFGRRTVRGPPPIRSGADHRPGHALPEATKRQIEGLTVHHSIAYSRQTLGFEFSDSEQEALKGAVHPLVRLHPVTKRKALFLGRRPGAYIHGLSVEESEKVLDAVWAHATQERFAWYQKWRAGDLVLWDNRCVMHRRDAFDYAQLCMSDFMYAFRTALKQNPTRAKALELKLLPIPNYVQTSYQKHWQ